MGLMQKWTEMTIGSSAYAFQSKHGLPFRDALERSLLQTRPGWTQGVLDTISPALDRATTEKEMICIVAKYAFENKL